MNKVFVFDIGAIQFRAIFNYLGQYKRNLNKILEDKGIDLENVSASDRAVIESKNELNNKIRNYEIFIGNPDYTFCNMISGYCNTLEVDLEDLVVCSQDFGSWRKDYSKEYKSQRRTFLIDTIMKSLKVEQSEAEKWIQNQYDKFDDLYKKLDISLPFNWIKKYKNEADDIASASCRYYKDKEIILVTTDNDWSMLLSFPNVKIFSPITKKFKEVKNPMSILAEKMNKDVSDNLLTKPSSEREWEIRKKIVDLISPLPDFVEQPIRAELSKILPKNIYPERIPFNSIRKKFIKIYNL